MGNRLSISLLALALGTLLALGGCAADKGKVLGVSNQDALAVSVEGVTDLSPDDMVLLMRRAGFTDQQILDLGPDLHNALAAQGAAEIRINNKVQAIFAVNEDRLHVSSRGRGTFVYALDPTVPSGLIPAQPAGGVAP